MLLNIGSFNKEILDNLFEGAYILDTNRVITYWNKSAEKISGYNSEEAIGKCCRNNIMVHVDEKGNNLCKGFCPVTKALMDGTIHENNMFLHHKDGHRVPVSVKMLPIRDSSDKVVSVLELFTDTSCNILGTKKINELVKLSFLDNVTTLVNKRYMETKLNFLLSETKQTNIHFGVLLFKLGNLNSIDEKFGTPVKESMLKTIANTIVSNTKSTDIVSRWNIDEFLIVFPDIKKSLFLMLSNKLKNLIEQSFITVDSTKITVTPYGGGSFSKELDTTETLIKRLYDLLLQSQDIDGTAVKLD